MNTAPLPPDLLSGPVPCPEQHMQSWSSSDWVLSLYVAALAAAVSFRQGLVEHTSQDAYATSAGVLDCIHKNPRGNWGCVGQIWRSEQLQSSPRWLERALAVAYAPACSCLHPDAPETWLARTPVEKAAFVASENRTCHACPIYAAPLSASPLCQCCAGRYVSLKKHTAGLLDRCGCQRHSRP